MTAKERDQITIFEHIKQKLITQKQACTILKISYRQVKRRYKKYLIFGPDGLIHGSRGRASNRKLDPTIKERILALLKDQLKGFGPTFAAEKISELYNIKISNETIRKFMIANGLWQVNKKKLSRHFWRERKHCLGELIQLDGSKHLWFNGEYYTLIAFIDDATSRIMHAHFAPEETIKDIAIATKNYIAQHGRPLAIYTDRGKVFKVNKGKNRGLTQYERMLEELNIELIHAYSPQAKGRIERLFKTCQDRLVKEFKLHGIHDLEGANKYLHDVYIPQHNEKFAVTPKNNTNMHRSIDGLDIKAIFLIKVFRTLREDNTVVFKNRLLLLDKKQPIILKRHQKITVFVSWDKTIRLMVENVALAFREIAAEDVPKKQKEQRRKMELGKPYKPPRSHPWRVWQDREESDISKLQKR
jgi:transposase InsO family protein